MKRTYQITLKPVGSFYFGGEESFSDAPLGVVKSNEAPAKEYFKKRQGYFAKSEIFPQQTQLLGMIRKEILRANNKLFYFKNFVRVPTNLKNNAFKLVGCKKWCADEDLDLGVIETLSPLYIAKEKNGKMIRYIHEPFNGNYLLEEKEGVGYINGKPTLKVYALKDKNGNYFNAKTYLSSDFVASKSDKVTIDEIFTSHTRTHTQTLPYKEDDEEKLFKVMRYTMHRDYSFLFYLTTSDKVFENGFTTTVSIGGEGSYFMMQVKEQEEKKIDTSFLENRDSRIVLISDAYIKSPISLENGDKKEKESIFDLCKLILADKTILRTIESKSNYHSFKKSQKYILFKKGTVFYPKKGQEEEVKKLIKGYSNFRKIGYNHYIDLTEGANNGN